MLRWNYSAPDTNRTISHGLSEYHKRQVWSQLGSPIPAKGQIGLTFSLVDQLTVIPMTAGLLD
jgi:hypothetical protein